MSGENFEEIMFYMTLFGLYTYKNVCSLWHGGIHLSEWEYQRRTLGIILENLKLESLCELYLAKTQTL